MLHLNSSDTVTQNTTIIAWKVLLIEPYQHFVSLKDYQSLSASSAQRSARLPLTAQKSAPNFSFEGSNLFSVSEKNPFGLMFLLCIEENRPFGLKPLLLGVSSLRRRLALDLFPEKSPSFDHIKVLLSTSCSPESGLSITIRSDLSPL